MMTRTFSTALLSCSILLAAVAAPLPAGADAMAPDFGAYCSEPLPAERQRKFSDNRTAAERALSAGQVRPAQDAYGKALSAAYRGGAESDISVKCLGRDTAARWHELKLDLKRAVTADRNSTDLYLVAADQGAGGLVKTVAGSKPNRVRGQVSEIERIAARLKADQDYGAFLLPPEQDILAACKSALPEIRKQAARMVARALEAEDTAFNRPVSAQERGMVQDVNNMASALAGIDAPLTRDSEVLFLERRVDDSMEQLSTARSWDLEGADYPQETEWGKRARERGDTVLEKAENGDLSFQGRDSLYSRASRYYDFGEWLSERDRADAKREAIQNDLAAEESRREQQLEAARVEAERRAASMQEAARDMMKSEEEQAEFRKEADAMEAELGF